MSELRHHLLCPMQCQENGVNINTCPRIYCNDPNQESHAIVTEYEYGDNVILPFFLNGATSHLNVDTLICDEFEAHDCPRPTFNHRDMTWDPSTTIYEDQKMLCWIKKVIFSAHMLQQGDRLCLLTLCVWLLNLCVCKPVKTLQTSRLTTILKMFYSQMSMYIMSI